MNNIKEYIDKEIEISGFVDSIRILQFVTFIILRNDLDKIQITIEKESNGELIDKVKDLTLESTIKVKGILKFNDKVKLNNLEIIPSDIVITSIADINLPISIKEVNESLRERRLDYRFLDLRREENQLLFKCQSYIESLMREYWSNNDYIEIHTPKICASVAESGAETFKLDYFGEKACLSQSPQFYKQMAIAAGFNKVFEIGQVFRAENSHTSYHAAEILMVDVEISNINSVEDVMDEEENWIRYIILKLFEKYEKKIIDKFKITKAKVENKFPRIQFDEAKDIIKKEYNYISEKADDLDKKDEEYICKYANEKYDSDFVFITNFPYSARSFYVMKDENGVTQTYDLLYRGIEITSGAQREHRYDILKSQIIEKGLDPKDLDFYLEFFKYGCPPHGGFGTGLARIIMSIFEIDNIREATFIYRGPTRLRP